MSAVSQPISWSKTDDPDYPYTAVINDRIWRLRINDFPEQALYTLLIDEQEVGDLEDWPRRWSRDQLKADR